MSLKTSPTPNNMASAKQTDRMSGENRTTFLWRKRIKGPLSTGLSIVSRRDIGKGYLRGGSP